MTEPRWDNRNGLKHSRAIVAGYGPVGRLVADRLERAGLKITIVELNPDTVERQLTLDRHIVHGDVTSAEVLGRAGIDTADALILTVPNEEAVLRACQLARELQPRIFIAARTNYLSRGLRCKQAGANHVVVEEVVTAEAMQQAVVEQLLGIRTE